MITKRSPPRKKLALSVLLVVTTLLAGSKSHADVLINYNKAEAFYQFPFELTETLEPFTFDSICATPSGKYGIGSANYYDPAGTLPMTPKIYLVNLLKDTLEIRIDDRMAEIDVTTLSYDAYTIENVYRCEFLDETSVLIMHTDGTNNNRLSLFTVDWEANTIVGSDTPFTSLDIGADGPLNTSDSSGPFIAISNSANLCFLLNSPRGLESNCETWANIDTSTGAAVLLNFERYNPFVFIASAAVMSIVDISKDDIYTIRMLSSTDLTDISSVDQNSVDPGNYLIAQSSSVLIEYRRIRSGEFELVTTINFISPSFSPPTVGITSNQGIINILGTVSFFFIIEDDAFLVEMTGSDVSLDVRNRGDIDPTLDVFVPFRLFNMVDITASVVPTSVRRLNKDSSKIALFYGTGGPQMVAISIISQCAEECDTCSRPANPRRCTSCMDFKAIAGPGPCECSETCGGECIEYNNPNACTNCPDDEEIEFVPDTQATPDNQFGSCVQKEMIGEGQIVELSNAPVSNCGQGSDEGITGCLRCSSEHEGKCALCMAGLGLFRYTDDFTAGKECVSCGIDSCESCEMDAESTTRRCSSCEGNLTLDEMEDGTQYCRFSSRRTVTVLIVLSLFLRWF